MKKILGLLLAMTVASCWMSGCNYEPASTSDQPRELNRDSRNAYIAGREFVRRTLKAPSSALFWKRNKPMQSDENQEASIYGPDTWIASGTVESQNGFGAMTQSDWQAIVRKNEDGWRFVWLRVGDEPLGDLPKSFKQIREEEERAKVNEAEEAARQKADAERQKLRLAAIEKQKSAEAEKVLRVFNWKLSQASNGYPSFQYDTARAFLEGSIVEKDERLARHWLQSAMTNGSIEASNAFKKFFGSESPK